MTLKITVESKYNREDYTFPLSPQQKKLHSHIQGRTWVDPYFQVPADKQQLWQTKGYSNVYQYALERAERSGRTLKAEIQATRWYISFNQPKLYIIYTKTLTEQQLNLTKFLIQRGTDVGIEAIEQNFKTVIPAIYNLYEDPHFQRYKVEDYHDIKDTLNPETKAKVEHKYTVLETKRNQIMDYHVWPKVNEALKEANDLINETKADNTRTFIKTQQRNEAIDVLKTYGASITVDDLREGEQALNEILRELETWARPLGITEPEGQLKLTPTDSNYNTYKFLHQYNHEKALGNNALKVKSSQDATPLADILRAYIHIQYLKEQPQLFLEPGWMLCRCCNYPMYEEQDYCDYCDDPNDNVVPETERLSSDIMDINIHRAKKL